MNSGAQKIAVIGGGIIGSWAALHLAEAGVHTSLFEQYPLPHTRGSSHGASRAFRFLGDETMDRLDYSMERWTSLERASGETLFRRTGLLNFGPEGDPWLGRHMDIVSAAGKPCGWLDAVAIRKRFPRLRYPDEWGAAWDPNGGILFAHRCLAATQRQFLEVGGSLRNECVRAVHEKADGSVALETMIPGDDRTRTHRFDQAVVACGPWTAKLLPRRSVHLRTLAIPVTYWRDLDGGHGVADGFPILYNARLKQVYALPACEYPGLVKVLYHGGPEADPDHRDVPARQEYVDHVSSYVREHLPGLDWWQPAIQETCMYTMTPDNEPVIDRLSDSLVIGCGFSGSGFKHSPATGRMLALLAQGKEENLAPGYQLEKYRHGRF